MPRAHADGARPSGSTSSPRRHGRRRLDRRPRDRAPARRRRRRHPARGDAAQAARRLAHPPGLRRDQRHRHADAARGGVEAGVGRSSTRARRARSAAAGSAAGARRIGSPRTRPVPRNIYGVTKVAAEDVCELVHRDHGLPILILRTSRFFPEADDRDDVRAAYEDANLGRRALYRRVDLADIVTRAPARAGEGAGARLRPLHHQRHDAVRARGTRRAAHPTRRPWWSVTCRVAALYDQLGWRMFERSSASTSTPPPARDSAGRRATTRVGARAARRAARSGAAS